jgi:hypothetical protein
LVVTEESDIDQDYLYEVKELKTTPEQEKEEEKQLLIRKK